MAGIYALRKIKGEKDIRVSDKTVLGSLERYITTDNKDFQPMNANFGVLPPLYKIVRDKAERKRQMAERSLLEISSFKKEIEL